MRAAQCIEREAELADRAGLEVLHEHVGLGEERRQHGLVVIAREIEHQQFLAAVEPDEVGALAITFGIRAFTPVFLQSIRAFTPVFLRNKIAWLRQLVVAAGEVALGPLDLDHARAGIGEAAGAHRRRHRLLERDDEKAGQRQGHGRSDWGRGEEIVGTLTMNGDGFTRRHVDAISFRTGGVLPPPLWGRVGEGGSVAARDVSANCYPHP